MPSDRSERRCLVVEDEMLVAMMLEDTLEELGYAVIGPVSDAEQAMAVVAAAGDALDGVVLDVNLGGERAYALADELVARRIPFVFVTGYRSEDLEERFSGAPLVQKPFTAATLQAVLAAAFAPAARPGSRGSSAEAH